MSLASLLRGSPDLCNGAAFVELWLTEHMEFVFILAVIKFYGDNSDEHKICNKKSSVANISSI